MSAPETTIDEVADGIYRIHTPVAELPGGFSFNQYLVADEAPLLFHTGPRGLAPAVIAAIERVLPVRTLRYVGLAHVEADECGGLNALLAAAPDALPVCSQVGAMVQVTDLADRPPRPLGNGETLSLGAKTVRFLDAPFVPHGWDNGYLFEESTKTLFCGDLFTQPGTGERAVTDGDILGPSEAFRGQMDYFSHAPGTRPTLERLAALRPETLACMHGSTWRGDGDGLLRALADAVAPGG